ncbi:MAG TPA: CsgG/HfaB family protein [Nitrospirota bacterium]|nr:CsgG/HfaB family protein [Nitrospirota bacterium]
MKCLRASLLLLPLILIYIPCNAGLCFAEGNTIKVVEIQPDPFLPLVLSSEVHFMVKVEYNMVDPLGDITVIIQKGEFGGVDPIIASIRKVVPKGSGSIVLEQTARVPETRVLKVATQILGFGTTIINHTNDTLDFKEYSVIKPYNIVLVNPNIQQVEMSNLSLKRSYSFGGPQRFKIEELLAKRDFQSLEQLLEQMLRQYKIDTQYEGYLQQAYESFSPFYEIALRDLDLWVSTRGSYISFCARGVYKALQASSVFEKNKHQLYLDASNDLQTSIKKNPSLMPAYTWLIKIATKTSDVPFTAIEILKQAEKNDPSTFNVRYEYMMSLKPAFGGSYEKMNVFSVQAAKYANLNPLLWSLQGEVDADRADNSYRDDNCAAAIKYYTAALKFGDRTSWLKNRAYCYERLGQNNEARADFERIRYYNLQDNAVVARSPLVDLSTMNYQVKENGYVDPKINTYNIHSYVVLPVEHHVEFLDARPWEGQRVIKRNTDKIELMMLRLGHECVERAKLEALLREQKLSQTGLTIEKAQYVGKLINADAAIITTIPGMGIHHSQSAYFVDIDIKAVSVSTGQILWKSLLKGFVVTELFGNDYEVVLDNIETKLYELLERKLNEKMHP